jgi:hypothetical protein
VASDGYTKFDGAEPVSPRFFLPVVGGVPLLTVIIIADFGIEYKS